MISNIIDMNIVEESSENRRGSSPPQRQRIKFNLDNSRLSCFISKKPSKRKSRDNGHHTHVPQAEFKTPLPILKNRPSISQTPSAFELHFKHQVVFTSYGQHQMYVDSEESISQREKISEDRCEDSNNNADDLVAQCVRAITEETSDRGSQKSFRPNPEEIIRTPSQFKLYSYQMRVPKIHNYQINLYNVENDGRTTIMLRNIPNKYTQDMILQQIDQCGLYHKYDFFYLPIDLKNDCNVGYAFINLISTKFIFILCQQFNGSRWRRFNSQKICEVCYARLQGTDQLINHFRYSNTFHQKDWKSKPLIFLNLQKMQNIQDIVHKQQNEQLH